MSGFPEKKPLAILNYVHAPMSRYTFYDNYNRTVVNPLIKMKEDVAARAFSSLRISNYVACEHLSSLTHFKLCFDHQVKEVCKFFLFSRNFLPVFEDSLALAIFVLNFSLPKKLICEYVLSVCSFTPSDV